MRRYTITDTQKHTDYDSTPFSRNDSSSFQMKTQTKKPIGLHPGKENNKENNK